MSLAIPPDKVDSNVPTRFSDGVLPVKSSPEMNERETVSVLYTRAVLRMANGLSASRLCFTFPSSLDKVIANGLSNLLKDSKNDNGRFVLQNLLGT